MFTDVGFSPNVDAVVLQYIALNCALGIAPGIVVVF